MNASPQHNNGPELASKRDFLLSSMRLAIRNLRTWQTELEFIGTGLRGGILSVDAAVEALDDIGLLEWLPNEAATHNNNDRAAT